MISYIYNFLKQGLKDKTIISGSNLLNEISALITNVTLKNKVLKHIKLLNIYNNNKITQQQLLIKETQKYLNTFESFVNCSENLVVLGIGFMTDCLALHSDLKPIIEKHSTEFITIKQNYETFHINIPDLLTLLLEKYNLSAKYNSLSKELIFEDSSFATVKKVYLAIAEILNITVEISQLQHEILLETFNKYLN